jgi:hypothetical protein
MEYIVTLSALSIPAMGESRYWEIHVLAISSAEAIEKAKAASATWLVYDHHYAILAPWMDSAPVGSLAYKDATAL